MIKIFEYNILFLVSLYLIYSVFTNIVLINNNDIKMMFKKEMIQETIIFFGIQEDYSSKEFNNFLSNFELANKKYRLVPKINLFFGEIDPKFIEKYYLYYYTLPKIIYFINSDYYIYDGSKSLNHIEQWFKRQKRISKYSKVK